VTPKRAGIYIHIPFCARKCTYCNFNTTDFFEELAERYTSAVEREICSWGDDLRHQASVSSAGDARHQGKANDDESRLAVDSIYFGGGTPSIIEAEQLSRLVDACERSFDVIPGVEITIEINPGTLSLRKAETWLRAGINRASVGVQSFIDRELKSLSRTHSAEEARQTVALLRESGFSNISLDLITGLPGQGLEDWQYNLQEALRLRPEHLSLYLLEVKEGTQLYAQIKREQREMPNDDIAAQMYLVTCSSVMAEGYRQYEISNFALDLTGSRTAEQFESKHNLKYWTGAPFYGMGCGAHSYDGRARWINTMQAEAYIKQVETSGRAIVAHRRLTSEERANEALFMWLRLTDGVSLEEFRREYGVDVLGQFGDELPRLRDAGLVKVDRDRLSLTERGRLLSNEVFVALV
jgi:oxygen-independent coproporphyrinogen-3 oxidase